MTESSETILLDALVEAIESHQVLVTTFLVRGETERCENVLSWLCYLRLVHDAVVTEGQLDVPLRVLAGEIPLWDEGVAPLWGEESGAGRM